MTIQIKDSDPGFKKTRRRLKFGPRVWAHVGVSDVPHEPDGGPTDEIGFAHEFGIGVPERSFLRAWVDENMGPIREKVVQLAAEVVAEELTEREAHTALGAWAAKGVRDKIMRGIAPPLAIRTVLAKEKAGYADPGTALFATGQLLDAIIFETPELVAPEGGGSA
jgi:hypothetical protein